MRKHIILSGIFIGALSGVFSDENPVVGWSFFGSDSSKNASSEHSKGELLSDVPPSSHCDTGHHKPNSSISETARKEHQNFNNDFFLSADFIYWNVHQAGNDYASFGVTNTGDAINALADTADWAVTSQGQVYHPHGKMSPGFKVAAGVNLAKDLWDVEFCYTWIRSHTDGQTPELENPVLAEQFPLKPIFNYPSISTSSGTPYLATVDSKIHFQSVDAELGKNFFLSPSFNLRTFVGLKGAWSKEQLAINYLSSAYWNTFNSQVLGDPLPSPPVFSFPSPDGDLLISYTQHFWGLGPRIGSYGLWKLWNNHIELFSEMAISALWSQMHLVQKSFDTQNTSYINFQITEGVVQPQNIAYSNQLIADQSYRTHSLIPVFELSLGLQTEWIFECGSRFLMSAAWETQMFLFMLKHSSTIADTSFTMEGLTLKFRYDF